MAGGRLGPGDVPLGMFCHPTTVESSILAKNLDGKICPTTTGQDRVNPVGNNCNDLSKDNNLLASREIIAMT